MARSAPTPRPTRGRYWCWWSRETCCAATRTPWSPPFPHTGSTGAKPKLREEDRKGTPLAPIFTGSLGPDAVFLGFEFDLPPDEDVEVAVRGSSDPADELPGWYFVFEQPPTEPAYGLDTAASDESPALQLWKDLTWDDARVSPTDTHVGLAALGSRRLAYDDQGENTWEETWGDSAAGMARITLQRPVRMLVHADQMLAPGEAEGGA